MPDSPIDEPAAGEAEPTAPSAAPFAEALTSPVEPSPAEPTIPISSAEAHNPHIAPAEPLAGATPAPQAPEAAGADTLSPASVPSALPGGAEAAAVESPAEIPTVAAPIEIPNESAAEIPTVAAAIESPAETPTETPTDAAASAEVPEAAPGAVPPPPPVPVTVAPRKPRGVRQVILAGLAGGLVGALVASGVYVAVDDDSTSKTVAPSAAQVVVRPSNKIARTGDIASILQADVPAVVAVVDDGGPDSGGAAGTGFVISSDGVIVTNNHVVEGANKIQAIFSDGTSKSAKVLGRNALSDLAVLKVDGTNLPTIQLGDSDNVQVGDDVVAIGNALALQGGLSVTRGIVSGLHREVDTSSGSALEDVIQTDAAINPGNSGGPLVDSQGRVIGINTAIADPGFAQNVGFAIPISNAKAIIDQLRNGKQPAFLGVHSQNLDQAKADGHQISADSGTYIVSVESGTPAAKAGIKAGDVITEVGGKPIDSAAKLGSVIRQYKPGDTVDIVLDRDGKSVTVSATLGEGPTS